MFKKTKKIKKITVDFDEKFRDSYLVEMDINDIYFSVSCKIKKNGKMSCINDNNDDFFKSGLAEFLDELDADNDDIAMVQEKIESCCLKNLKNA